MDSAAHPSPASAPLQISYPPELPVSRLRDEIAEAIRDHQVVIVAGETGSGKTTQLPKICLELGRTMIGHTQPRRIAARTIAERIADELGGEIGGLVGYQVRFTDEVSKDTRVKLMTDGILLNEIHRDRLLKKYDTIIIDEAHERSLNIDFLLGYLKRILPKRPDLKVIITSATIDPESFSKHFFDAPMIEVSGRTYPVDVRYRPLVADDELDGDDEDAEYGVDDLPAARGAAAARSDAAPVGDVNAPGVAGMRARAAAKAAKAQAKGAGRGGGKATGKTTGKGGAKGRGANADAPAPGRADRDMFEGIVDALDELEREEPGDVLVFLPGEQEIRDAQDAIRGHLQRRGRPEATEVLPLYGRLSAADQHRIFDTRRAPGVRRRVVLATNVAETSLTVPGIAYVIDTGTARISRYSTRAKVQRLPVEPISQASANQRSGRSGRTRPGICIRLYSEADFERRPEFTDPEILRTNLASVLLQMLELGLGEIGDFPFLQAPDPRGVKDGLDLLQELGAITAAPANERGGRNRPGGRSGPDGRGRGPKGRDERADPDAGAGAKRPHRRLTRIGRDLARLPIDPRYARMVVESKRHDVSREILVIVAGLSVQDIRERPLEHRQKATELHARFKDPTSDFLSLLRLWDYLEEQSKELGSSAFRRLCRDEFLNFVRFREWQDVVRQLRQLAGPLGLDVRRSDIGHEEPGARADGIHRAMLSGLLSHIGVYDQVKRDYLGARGTRFTVFPGSGLAKATHDAVMAGELVETSRLFARTVAKIDPAWAEELAGDLVKRQHSEPHWEKKQGSAVATEKATLYGVPIVRGRTVQFSRIDPKWSRDLFIRHALVEGDWDAHYAFDRKNAQLRRELEQIEERERRRDILGDDETVFAFYDERVPEDVVSQPTFDRWWREAQKHTPELLTMRRGDLLDEEGEELASDADRFPANWHQGDQRLKVRYRFDPGAKDDGVTVIVPLPLLARLDPVGFDWQVPGMRAELITALLRSLPKSIRRGFVPAADWAAKLDAEIGDVRPDRGEAVPGPLDETLRQVMQRLAGIRFDVSEFDWSRVPEHLRVRFRVLDDRGRELGAGEDLAALQARLKRASEASLVRATRQAVSGGTGAGAGSPGGGRPGDRRGRAGAGSGAEAVDAGAGAAGADGAAAGDDFEQHDLTGWPLDEIPAFIDIRRKNGVIRAYPTLKLAGGRQGSAQRVDLALVTTADDQRREHSRAMATLVAKSIPSPVSYVQSHLTATEKLSLAASPYATTQALLDDVVRALATDAVAAAERASGGALVRTRAGFEAVRDSLNASLVDALFANTKLVADILGRHREALAALKAANHLSVLPSLTDARGQIDALVFDGFVSRTGIARLPHLVRYLRGAAMRLERLRDNVSLERAGLVSIEQATALYREAGGELPASPEAPEELVRVRWLLEEFRVSLFAQQLGTAETVSLKRIRQALPN